MSSSLFVFFKSMVVISFRSCCSVGKHGGGVKNFSGGEKVEFWQIEGLEFGFLYISTKPEAK